MKYLIIKNQSVTYWVTIKIPLDEVMRSDIFSPYETEDSKGWATKAWVEE